MVVDSLLIVTPIVGFRNCSMFCCAMLCVLSSFAIILMGKRERERERERERDRAGCFALFVFLVSHDWCVAPPIGATGLSVVCDCDIPDHTHYFRMYRFPFIELIFVQYILC